MSNESTGRLNDKWFRLIGNPLSEVIFKLIQLPFFASDKWTFLLKFLISLAFTVLAWEITRLIIIRARQRYPNLNQTGHRIGNTIFWLAVEMILLHLALSKLLFATGLAATTSFSFLQFWLANAGIGFLVFAFIGGIYEAMYFFHQYKLAVQKAEELKKQQTQQRLEALKNQVNPHFLFNSLTTLSALIGEDAQRAERFLDELSKVYRYLLRAGRLPVVPLEEELQFADSYIFLLQNRFEEGALTLVMPPGPPKKEVTLPALSLQNLLDYLIRTQNLPLHIELHLENGHLTATCGHRPKSISFEASDNDWRQLEVHGAKTEVLGEKLKIHVPFHPNRPAA